MDKIKKDTELKIGMKVKFKDDFSKTNAHKGNYIFQGKEGIIVNIAPLNRTKRYFVQVEDINAILHWDFGSFDINWMFEQYPNILLNML